MKDKTNPKLENILRQKAEELLEKKSINTDKHFTDVEIFKLVHELNVHQIELEMQNEELNSAKIKAEVEAEKYTNLYDFAPSGYFTLSKKGDIIELNLIGSTLLGKERSLAVNNRFSLFVADESKSIFILFLEKIFESKTRQTCEILLSTNSETPTFVNLTGIVDENGNQCAITMHDVSQHKKAEEETKINKERYQTLFESNRDSITIFRIDKDGNPGNFIEANPATTTLLGYTKEELLAMSIVDIEIVSDKKRKSRIATGIADGRLDFETIIKTKKGNHRNVEVETIIINYLNEPAVMNITRDITERKQTEENTRKVQENLTTILEAIPDLLFEVDFEGRIYHYQAHRENLLATSPSDFMGKTFHEVIPADAAKVCLDALQEADKKGWSIGKQYSLDLPQGKHWFELSVSPIKDNNNNNNKDKHFIILARDITNRKKAEKSLQENKENLECVFNSVSEAIYIMDKTGTFIDVNKGAEKMYQYSRTELIGKKPQDLAAPGLNDLDEVQEITQKVFKNGVSISFEFWAVRKNGEVFPKDVVVNKGTYFSKDVLIITARDITERKNTEKNLQKSQQKLQGLFNVANSGIVLIDISGNFLLFNDWCCKLLGYTKSEFQKLSTKAISHPDDLEKTNILNKKLIDGEIKNYQIEKRYQRKDKSYVWCEISASAIKDEDNNIVNIIGIVNDITDRIKNKEALEKSQEKLRGVFDLANSGIILTDLKGRYLLFNNWLTKALGYTRAELNKLIREDLTHPDDLEKSNLTFNNLIEGKTDRYQIEKRYVRKDKSCFWAEISVSAIKDKNNKVVNTIGIINDITDKRAAKIALQESEARLIEAQSVAKVGNWETDMSFTDVIWSKENYTIFGFDPDAGKPTLKQFLAIIHPEDRAKVESAFFSSIKSQTLNTFEHRIITADGVEKTLEQRWNFTRDEQGNPLQIVGTSQDITERKKAEEKLFANENFLKQTQTIANLGSYSLDFTTGKWTSTTILDNIFGIDANFVRSIDGWKSIIHPEWQTIMDEYLNNVVIGKNENFNKEYKIIKNNTKEERWLHGMGEIIFNLEGQPLSMIGSIQDITHKKLTEEKIKESSEKFQSLVNSTGGIVWEADAQTIVFNYVSQEAERLFGYSAEEWYEEGFWANHLHPDDKEKTIAYCANQTEKMLAHDFKYRFRAKNGKYVWLKDVVNVVVEDGKSRWLRGVMYDITKQEETIEFLSESEEKYRSLVENSPDGVVIYVEDKIAYINDEGIRMLGAKDKKEIIGKPVFQFVHPDSLEDIGKKMKEIITDNYISKSVEEKFIRMDGTPFDVEVKGIPTLYEHKKAVQIIVHDITLRKQNNLELNKINRVYALISQINNLIIRTRNREELFQEICNIAVDFGKFRMSWIGLLNENNKIITGAFAGHENGYFTKSNITSIDDEPEGRGPTGIALREVRTVICNDIANDPMMKPWRKDALERGYSSVISIPIIVRNTKIGVFNLYSEEKNFFSSEEEISLLEKIILNISFALEKIQIEEDRKHTEEKIRQLSQAVEQSPITIVITNTKGEIEYANPKFVETTGYTIEEVLGKNPRVLKSGHSSHKEYKNLWQTIAAGNEWHGEFHNKRKDGSLYWESATISPIVNTEGKTTHFIAIKEDITQRKKAEKELIKSKDRAEESDRLKLVFLANMSHEIRTPMNGILGFTELLKEPKLSGKQQQEYIKIIEKSGMRMLNIINDIISISKVESGQIEVSMSATNINEQIEYIQTFFKPEAKQKGIELYVSKQLRSKDSYVITDQEKVYAVLTNLVKNAIKFTNGGSIKFGCEKKGEYLEFFITDTGLGISKSQKKIIFERFRQANETISRSHEGSGLGLAISKAYVEILGGKIWAESKKGIGSTFYFTIPFHSENKSEEINSIEKEVSVTKDKSTIKDLKILIVEDDAISKLLVTIAVKPYSKEILKVSTGIEAVEACQNNPDIDLVMMDINMPEMGGYEATKLIREFNKDLVIIAQTANGMQSDRDDAIAAGCTNYISKPIDITSLGDLIQKYFSK